jgi:hypothetical protein
LCCQFEALLEWPRTRLNGRVADHPDVLEQPETGVMPKNDTPDVLRQLEGFELIETLWYCIDFGYGLG